MQSAFFRIFRIFFAFSGYTILSYDGLTAPDGVRTIVCGCPTGRTCAVAAGPRGLILDVADPSAGAAPARDSPRRTWVLVVIVGGAFVGVVFLLITGVTCCVMRRARRNARRTRKPDAKAALARDAAAGGKHSADVLSSAGKQSADAFSSAGKQSAEAFSSAAVGLPHGPWSLGSLGLRKPAGLLASELEHWSASAYEIPSPEVGVAAEAVAVPLPSPRVQTPRGKALAMGGRHADGWVPAGLVPAPAFPAAPWAPSRAPPSPRYAPPTPRAASGAPVQPPSPAARGTAPWGSGEQSSSPSVRLAVRGQSPSPSVHLAVRGQSPLHSVRPEVRGQPPSASPRRPVPGVFQESPFTSPRRVLVPGVHTQSTPTSVRQGASGGLQGLSASPSPRPATAGGSSAARESVRPRVRAPHVQRRGVSGGRRQRKATQAIRHRRHLLCGTAVGVDGDVLPLAYR